MSAPRHPYALGKEMPTREAAEAEAQAIADRSGGPCMVLVWGVPHCDPVWTVKAGEPGDLSRGCMGPSDGVWGIHRPASDEPAEPLED